MLTTLKGEWYMRTLLLTVNWLSCMELKAAGYACLSRLKINPMYMFTSESAGRGRVNKRGA